MLRFALLRLSFQVMSYEQRQASESLYRDANSLIYADNTPDEDAIDRVVHKLNIEYVLRLTSFWCR